MNEQAIRVYAYGGPEQLELETVDVGDPGPGEVRIRHHAVGINFADTYFRTGLYPSSLPSGIGVEGSGVVEAVGAAVDFAPGDRVTYTGSSLGAYSTARTMPADTLIRLPDEVAFDAAASLTMRGLTASYLLRRIWPLEPGDTVLFHAAAGGVGLVFCQWAKLLGVRVIGTASTDRKAEIAIDHGCSDVIDSKADIVAEVSRLTNGRGVKVVYDGVGRDTFDASIRCLARRGLMVCFGAGASDRDAGAGSSRLTVSDPAGARRLLG